MACGHAEAPGADVTIGPSRSCPEGIVDDGFECLAKRADEARPDRDGDDGALAEEKRSRECGPLDDCAFANAPSDEEQYFAQGERYFRKHDYRTARTVFFEMLQKYPDGRHPDDAYFYFGKMFEDEGLQDPTKLPLAAQSFEQVLTYPTSSQQGAALVELVRAYGLMHDMTKLQQTLGRLKTFQAQSTPLPQVPPSSKPSPPGKPTPKVRLQSPPVP